MDHLGSPRTRHLAYLPPLKGRFWPGVLHLMGARVQEGLFHRRKPYFDTSSKAYSTVKYLHVDTVLPV